MAFTASKHGKLVDILEGKILDGKIEPGDKLDEFALLKENNVSRGTLREAFRALEQKGLIEMRRGPGGGTFIKKLDDKKVSETLALILRHGKVSIKHLEQFREAIEPTIAGYAAEMASIEDINKLRIIYAKGKTLIGPSKQDAVNLCRLELQLHKELANITKNPIFIWISGTIAINLDMYTAIFHDDIDAQREGLGDWENIIDAIEKSEVMRVVSLLKAHVIMYSDKMQELYLRRSY